MKTTIDMKTFLIFTLCSLISLCSYATCSSFWLTAGANIESTCANSKISFSAYADSVISVLWDFGDGTYSNKERITKAYDSNGDYTVKCTLKRSCGSDTVIINTIKIDDQLYFQDSGVYTNVSDSLCPNEEISLSYGGSGAGDIDVTWNLGGGIEPFTKAFNSDLSYSSAGSYPITAGMLDRCGNDTTLYDTIVVSNELKPSIGYFSFNADTLCVGEVGNFHFYFNQGVSNIKWTFSNGFVDASEFSVSTSFGNEGKYFYDMETKDYCGNTAVFTDSVVIASTRNSDPTTYFEIPDTICANVDFPLSASAGAKSVNWVISDGTNFTDSTDVVEHSFSQNGIYFVSVSGTDVCGVDFVGTDTIVVGSKLTVLSSRIEVPDTICIGQEFILAGGSPSVTCEWDLGDGNVSNEKVVRHSYTSSGLYYVTLTRTDSCGNSGQIQDSIIVDSDVKAKDNFAVGNLHEVCLGDSSSFLIYEKRLSYSIDFGDGHTGSFRWESFRYIEYDFSLQYAIVNHKYDSPGVYIVKVTVQNTCGNEFTSDYLHRVKDDTRFKNDIRIQTGMDDIFYNDKGSWCINSAVDFSVENGNRFTINFGDGTSENINGAMFNHVKHIYSQEGIYKVSVVGENACGEKDSSYVFVNIKGSCPLGLSAQSEKGYTEIKAFPVPSEGTVQFDLVYFQSGKVQVEIASLEGKIIDSFTTSENTFQYNFEQHGAGTYFVNVQSEKAVTSKKVIIVK